MNWNSLRYFVAIAEQGSLRAAADQLHISQSALSRQIINLEQELGVPLLERLPRGIDLTSAGQIFLRYAREGLAKYDLVKSDVSALQGMHRGTVRVSAPEAFSRLVLPDCMEAFRRRYPGVEIVARIVQSTQSVMTDVRDAAADFGIAYSGEIDPDMEVDFSMSTSIVAIMSPTNALASRKTLSLSDLAGVPLALPIAHSMTGELIYRAARRRGVRLDGVLRSTSVHMRLELALRTDVVALLADMIASDMVRSGRARAVPIAEPAFTRGAIRVLRLPRRRLSTAASAFQQMVIEGLKKLGPHEHHRP